jgi:ribosomal protein L9
MRLVFTKDTELYKKGSVVEVRDDLAIEYLSKKTARVVGRAARPISKAVRNKTSESTGGE